MFAFYLFFVSITTLFVLYTSAGTVVEHLLDLQAGTGFMAAERFMSAAGYLASAGLLWLGHWSILLKQRRQLGDTRDGFLMAYLLIVVSLLVLGVMVQGASVAGEAGALLDGFEAASGMKVAILGANFALTLVLWLHHLGQFIDQAKRKVAEEVVAETA